MARILVVDDSDQSQRFLRSLCEHRGHRVEVADDGAAGLRHAQATHPDLVISDVLLPSVSGYDLARQIRSDAALYGTRVVLTTAATVDGPLIELARACGVTTVIPKPSEPGAALDLIERALAAAAPPPLSGGSETVGAEQLRLLTADLSRKIDELQAANEGLQRSEERFRRLLGLAPAAIIGVDRSGRITIVNALAETLFGGRAEDFLGQPLELLVPEPLRETHVSHRAAYLRSPSVRPMGVGRELEARRIDGTRFPVTVSLSTFGEGDDLTVLAAVLDVTERVAAEKERARLEATLAQAQRLESVGQLAGGVAHDFNNLLAVIINYATFVERAVAGEPSVRDDARQIQDAARKGADLVRQLLLFSRSKPTTPEALALDEVLHDLHRLLGRSIGEHVRIDTVVDPGLPAVHMDRSKLEQVIVNLVVNARDAMPKGGTITVEASPVDVSPSEWLGAELAAGAYVRLVVADTGVGMTATVKEHAFDPFYTTKARGEGTGLGLATAYGIVTEAGGGIVLVSEPGEGTAVQLYLPSVEAGAPVGDARDGGATVHAGAGEVVLVVEDELGVREMIRRMLVQNNYHVLVAANAEDALTLLDRLPVAPALVVSDVVMPGLSGPELVHTVRRRWPGTPALLTSGYTGHVVDDLLINFDVIDKPFTESEILARVREAIGGAR